MARLLEERLPPETPREVHLYPEVGHSLLTDGHHPIARVFAFGMGIVDFNPAASEEGFRKIFAFFDHHLD